MHTCFAMLDFFAQKNSITRFSPRACSALVVICLCERKREKEEGEQNKRTKRTNSKREKSAASISCGGKSVYVRSLCESEDISIDVHTHIHIKNIKQSMRLKVKERET